jgi:hypothetical protein
MGVLAVLSTIVCGAWFQALPPGWHQSVSSATILSRGVSTSNTFSWASSRSIFDLTKPLPAGAVYIWVDINRPTRRLEGPRLRLPLRLRDATVIEQKGATAGLPEYRFEGRYRRQDQVIIGVDFGRAHPLANTRALAEQVLLGLVLPRWVPPRRRGRCHP